jgi:hypothetical protein
MERTREPDISNNEKQKGKKWQNIKFLSILSTDDVCLKTFSTRHLFSWATFLSFFSWTESWKYSWVHTLYYWISLLFKNREFLSTMSYNSCWRTS